MKIFIKLLALMLVAVMLFSFVACSDDKDTSSASKDESKTEESSKVASENDTPDNSSESEDSETNELLGHWQGEVDQTKEIFTAIIAYLSNGNATNEEYLGIFEHLQQTTAMPVTLSFYNDSAKLSVDTEWAEDLLDFTAAVNYAILAYYEAMDFTASDWIRNQTMSYQDNSKILEHAGLNEDAIAAMTVTGEYVYENGKLTFNGETEDLAIDGNTMTLDGAKFTKIVDVE